MEGNRTTVLLPFSTSVSSSLAPSPSAAPPDWFPGPSSPYSPAEAVIIGLILFCVVFGTVVGNILVCIAVCLVRKLRRPCNYLLVSLAVSDLCVAILVMPMALLFEILGRWDFGPVMCDLWVSFDVLSCTASILNLCMISVDRYYAITKPLEYGVKRTPRRMIGCVSLVWLGAACISLPPLLILGNEHGEMEGATGQKCIVCQNFGYQIYATLGSFYIPLTVMIVVYYKIFRAARKIVLEERRAQSHLGSHSYLEINVKNGSKPAEPKITITSATSSPAVSSSTTTAGRVQKHRTSTTSTNTTCSGQTGISSRCFASSATPRRSNESQCSMLQQQPHGGAAPIQKPKKKRLSGISFSRRNKTNNTVCNNTNNSGGVNVANHKKLRFALAKERKASTTLGIIMSAFTVCWLPFFVLALVRPFLADQEAIPSSLSSLFLWLGYANSLLNPIIYATLNRDFRKPFQEILYFRCGSLNHMMREEFYQSQYGDPDQHYCVISSNQNVGAKYEEAEEVIRTRRDDDEYVEGCETMITTEVHADESFL